MRRAVVTALVVLVVAPAAHAATLELGKTQFSPAIGRLTISASLRAPARAGVELASTRGRRLGWILPPARRHAVSLTWDGRLDGRRVRDGHYLVRLLVRRRIVVVRALHIDRTAPELGNLRIGNGNHPFSGDGPLLTTVSPNGDGWRDTAIIRFRLSEPAAVTLEATRTATTPKPFVTETKWYPAGSHAIVWKPVSTLNPRTYLLRLTTLDNAGNRRLYGAPTAFVGRYPLAPVVRIQGIDAGFTRQSYAPGQIATVQISTDAVSLTYQAFQVGPEHEVVYADNQLAGVAVPDSTPQTLGWLPWQNRPHTIQFTIGAWPSGLYYLSFTSPDGRIGYAPFVVRPAILGAASRVAVVLPTNTWEAYNFWDVDGNGYGNTWYAGPPNHTVDLSRPYIARGVPPRFYRYDLPMLHWLYWTGKTVDFVADSDFDLIKDGDGLAAAYDLVVFEGHEEYVTQHMFDVIQRYRDLGGNLAFLSANNFFWRVQRTGTVLRKIGQFRQVGHPEASVIGTAYRANDEGQRQGNFVVRSATTAPWLWEGTGLGDGSTFGAYVGGYGIEIDATTPDSPPGTLVLADIPDLYGPGYTAQMTYYETPAGAKVFGAGALDFGGSATFWPIRRMLENLWTHLSAP